MLDLSDEMEHIYEKNMKWVDIRMDGILTKDAKKLDVIGMPPYAAVENMEDYDNLTVLFHKEATDPFVETVAIIYGNEHGPFYLVLYDREELFDSDKEELELKVGTLQEAKREAEYNMKAAIDVCLPISNAYTAGIHKEEENNVKTLF